MQRMLRATLLIAILVISACTGTRQNIRLSDIAGGLNQLEESSYDPLQENPVSYTTIGEPKYDKFVKEAASLRATLIFALHSIERFERLIDGKSSPNPVDFILAWQLLTGTIPKTAERAAYLYTEGNRLKEEARTDFAWRFYKIPKAKHALEEARDNLLATRDMASELLERLQNLPLNIERSRLIPFSF